MRKQREVGIDIPDDGEFGKPMATNYDYGAWWNYAFARMQGFVPAESVPESQHKKSSVANMALTTVSNRRDWQKFSEFYQDPESTGTLLGSAARRRTRRWGTPLPSRQMPCSLSPLCSCADSGG